MAITSITVPTTLVLTELPGPELGARRPTVATVVDVREHHTAGTARPTAAARTAAARSIAGTAPRRRTAAEREADIWSPRVPVARPARGTVRGTVRRAPAPRLTLARLLTWWRTAVLTGWHRLGSWGAGPAGENLAWGRPAVRRRPEPPSPAFDRHRAPDDDDPVPMRERPSTPLPGPPVRSAQQAYLVRPAAPAVLMGRLSAMPARPRPAPVPAVATPAPAPAPVPAPLPQPPPPHPGPGRGAPPAWRGPIRSGGDPPPGGHGARGSCPDDASGRGPRGGLDVLQRPPGLAAAQRRGP